MEIKKVNEKDIEEFSKKEWAIFNRENGYTYKKEDVFYGAYENKDLTGYFSGEALGNIFYLKELLVKKEDRHKGIGQELWDRAEKIAKDMKCLRIVVKTSSKHESALKFYRKNGLKIDAELRKYWFGFDWYYLSKEL